MFMLRLMSWISLRLGRSCGQIILHLIVGYFLLFAPKSRRASNSYLRRALGRSVRWRDLYRHFFTFAATIHDRIYLVNNRFDLFQFEIHGEAELRKMLVDCKGLFLIGAHLGSFEVVRAIGRRHQGLRVAMVMHQDNAQKINAMLAAINPNAVNDIISLGHVDSMLQVHQCLEEGCMVGILADRTLGNDTRQLVRILDAEASVPTGPFRMAAMMRRPVVFMTGLYLGDNRYAIHFQKLADFSNMAHGEREQVIHAAIAHYAELLDQYCRLAPYNWFNFFDFWQSIPNHPAPK